MFFNKKYTDNCIIYSMLQKAERHVSFHTPGHKVGKWDITELSFSDNLSCPTGVLKQAEEDITSILSSARSFILTDGSTSGILSMVYAVKPKKLLFPVCSHKSVYNACQLTGAEAVTFDNEYFGNIPLQPTKKRIEEELIKSGADAVLITSPDYYGNIADYKGIKEVCATHGAALLVDHAHGSHLHGTELYAGKYADLWVDGVHKNLPCFTQGAVVSANRGHEEKLKAAVDIFRTTSPNYLIMASVEYGVKYPIRPRLVKRIENIKKKYGATKNADWSKAVFTFGENTDMVASFLEERGVYPEFSDGENVMFYFSPATSQKDLQTLTSLLEELSPLKKEPSGSLVRVEGERSNLTARVGFDEAVGKTCAENCGLFPPCIPVVRKGEVVTKEHIEKLKNAKNVFGIVENKILVYTV